MIPSYLSAEELKEGKADVAPERHTQRIAWPVYIIIGQALLLCFAFGFFAVVRAKGQVSLNPLLAEMVQLNPQSKTYVVTFLATALSTFSSYLFSQTIRHAIVVYLTRPLSVSTLGFGILISRRSLIFDRQLKWVFAAGVFFLVTLGQTASWTSLLTPIDILIPTPLKGTEIDLSSKAFSDQFQQLWVSDLQDYINGPLLSIIDASGATSATSQAGYPGVLDFAGWAHDISTRGIFPIQIVNSEDINNANTTHLVTVNTKPFPPTGFSRNISMSQHGLTATVSCQNQDLDGTTNPPLFRFADPAEITLDGESYSFTATSLSTTCSNGDTASSGTQLTSTNNTLLAVSCANVEGVGTTTYTVIIDGQGQQYDYMKTVVCTVSPQIQNMTTLYADQYIYTNFDESYPRIDAGPVGSAALYGLLAGFAYGQNEIRNVVGDSITSIFTDQVFEQETPTAFLELLEAYITGIVEFVGTAVKTDLSFGAGAFKGNPPQSMTRTIAGNATTATVGWEYSSTASHGILLPIIFVALACIFITLFAQYQNRGIPVRHADFDPNQPLHLMAAASTGGMLQIFHGMDQDDVKAGRVKKVQFGQVGDRNGFIQVV